MSTPALPQTTLSAAIAGGQAGPLRFSVASTAGMTAGSNVAPPSTLVIGGESFTVTNVVNSTVVDTERGQQASSAQAHASGTIVYIASPSTLGPLGTQSPSVYNLVAPATSLPQFTTVVGSKRMDPNTGYIYMLVDCQAALVNGEWVVIDGNGLASALASTSKGRVGILQEDVSASDTLAWVLVEGTYASALFTSSVTTACYLQAGTGAADLYGVSTDGNVIWGASCTVAPSTATSPTIGDGLGTAYISNPWVSGVATNIAPAT